MNEWMMYNQNFYQADQPIRLQYSNQIRLLYDYYHFNVVIFSSIINNFTCVKLNTKKSTLIPRKALI
jgi:hypothetical protein